MPTTDPKAASAHLHLTIEHLQRVRGYLADALKVARERAAYERTLPAMNDLIATKAIGDVWSGLVGSIADELAALDQHAEEVRGARASLATEIAELDRQAERARLRFAGAGDA